MSATGRAERHEQQTDGGSVGERVLRNCHVRLRRELNVPILLPYLNEYRLITADLHEELTLPATHAARVDKLVAELPRSGADFLERFIQCLRKSVEQTGTSHGLIADSLEELKLQELETSATLSVQLLSCELQSVSNWYQLGIKLGLEPYQLNQIEEKTTDIERRKIEMYDLWLRRTPGHSWSHIATALREMEEITTAERIQQKYGVTGSACNTETTEADYSDNATAITPLIVGTERPDQTGDDDEVQRPTNCYSRRWRWWCCCYTVVLVIVALLALALIILSQEPHVSPSVRPHYVFRNSTVELLFDYMPFLDQMALAVDKPNCEATLYQIQDQDCRSLPTLNTGYVNPNDKADNIYMLPGSVIDFTVNPDTRGEVWVFSDYDTDDEFVKDPSHFDCHSPPSGAYCFEAEDHPGKYPYYIQQPAYYFIHPPRPFNGAIVDWYFHRTIYDRDAIMKYPSTGILTQVPRTIYFPFPYKKSCILLDIPPMACDSGTILATNAVRQNGYLIFPGIFLGVWFITLIVLAIVNVSCCCRYCRRSSSS